MLKLKNLSQASTNVLDCRSMGHAWFHKDDEPTSNPNVSRRRERCERCGSERWRDINFTQLLILRRGTKYPDGYLLVEGSARVSRAQALAALYLRSR